MTKCVFDHGSECEALTHKHCAGCAFYKTARQLNEGRHKAEERLGHVENGLALYKKYYVAPHSETNDGQT